MITVLLVDDQALFAESLKTVIEVQSEDISVIGLASNGQEAIEMVDDLSPDIILMDVRMPVMDGVEATQIIHNSHPHIKIMMLTTFDDDAYVQDALKGGAIGYLLKNIPSHDLILSIRAVQKGTVQISPSLVTQLISSHSHKSEKESKKKEEQRHYDITLLSQREREVLYLMSRGYDNKQIAERLFVAEQTIKNHISRVYKKFNIHDRMSVMQAARNSELKEYCHALLDVE